MPVPTFIQNATHSVALHSADGITNIVKMFEESWALLRGQDVHVDGVGIVLDADDREQPATRHTELREHLTAIPHASLSWPATPGELAVGPPRCGAFVFPNNVDIGTLEDLLLEASATTFPGLHASAAALIAGVTTDPASLGLNSKDLKDFRKPAGARKATLGAVANVLRPGKSIAVAIPSRAYSAIAYALTQSARPARSSQSSDPTKAPEHIRDRPPRPQRAQITRARASASAGR